MINGKVSSTARSVTYELTPEDAQALVDSFPKDKEPSYDWRKILGPIYAIAQHREYGGH